MMMRTLPLIFGNHGLRFSARPPKPQAIVSKELIGVLSAHDVSFEDKKAKIDEAISKGFDFKSPEAAEILPISVAWTFDKNQAPLAQYLIDKGANLYGQTKRRALSALHVVVEYTHPSLATINVLLKADKAQQNKLLTLTDGQGFTPIHRAARRGLLGALKAFDAHDGDFTHKTPRNQNAYDLAVLSKKHPTVAFAHEVIQRQSKTS